MNNDLGRVAAFFDVDQLLDRFILLLAAQRRFDGDDFVFVAPLEEVVGLDQALDAAGVLDIFGDHQHERLDQRHAALAGVDFQFDFGVLVDANAVFDFDPLQLQFVILRRVEVLAGSNGWLFDKAILHGAAQWVAVNDILERLGFFRSPLDLRRRSQLQAKNWLEFVDCAHAGTSTVAVRFVHQQHQVVEPRKVVEIAFANVFAQPPNAWGAVAAYFTIDLRDVEDVDVNRVVE